MISASEPRLSPLRAFLNRPRPCWLVDGLLPAGEMAVLFGAYARGKSFVALELAGCISQGRRFAGRPARLGNVLYLLAEGCAGMRDRFDIMVKEGLIDPANVFIDDSGRQIGNPAEREALLTELAAQNFKPDFIIVDTLARHAVGVEENSAKEMGTWIAAVEALLTELSCTVLLVHHTGNTAQERMRGSSALSGAVSTSISCVKVGDVITLKCDKQKDADEFSPLSFRARKARHGDVESLVLDYDDAAKPKVARLKPNQVAMLSTLEAASPNSVMRAELKLINGSSIPDATFDRDIKELIALGYVEKISQGEYLLRKSPSPNDPHKSPMGIHSTPEKSPPASHPYRGEDVGIGAGVKEVKNVASSMSSAESTGGHVERIAVPTFIELNVWPLPNPRCEELLKH